MAPNSDLPPSLPLTAVPNTGRKGRLLGHDRESRGHSVPRIAISTQSLVLRKRNVSLFVLELLTPKTPQRKRQLSFWNNHRARPLPSSLRVWACLFSSEFCLLVFYSLALEYFTFLDFTFYLVHLGLCCFFPPLFLIPIFYRYLNLFHFPVIL